MCVLPFFNFGLMRYHILNGDALLHQLADLNEPKIVMRECLVEGDVSGATLDDFFKTREKVFQDYYQISPDGYRRHSVQEMQKINSIAEQDDIFLWFENDLFCQVNLWFILYYLNQRLNASKLFLVTPIKDSWKGFGALTNNELMESLYAASTLNPDDQSALVYLWIAYTRSDWDDLKLHGSRLKDKIDHIEDVIQAHIERFPTTCELGRPQKALLKIMGELEDPTFPEIFKAFCQDEGIYGFGDMQVSRLLKELNADIS